MSCTVMYQPYAMSYSSSSTSSSSSSSASCEKSSSADKKLFKLPQAPSPPDSLHSDASSYNSPGPSTQSASHTQSRRPLTPVISHSQHSLILTPPSRSSTCTTTSSSLDDHQDGTSAGSSPRQHPLPHHHHHQTHHTHPHHHSSSSHHTAHSSRHHGGGHPSATVTAASAAAAGPSGNQVQYLSANAAIYINYNGDVSRIVDEHFSRALSATYSTDKVTSKCSPMSTRNFPPSFWNSNYQPSKPLVNYSAAAAATAAEYYGAAVDYGTGLPTLTHHHQPDPWHYPLPPPHQTYHHRPTEIPYPPIPPSSRFNPSQYGSFLLAGAAASTGAGRFGGMGPPAQCGVKGVGDGGSWPGGRYHHHHHHDSHALSDLHNLADYSAAAAAHYSNMAAGLESTVVQDSTKDLYWF